MIRLLLISVLLVSTAFAQDGIVPLPSFDGDRPLRRSAHGAEPQTLWTNWQTPLPVGFSESHLAAYNGWLFAVQTANAPKLTRLQIADRGIGVELTDLTDQLPDGLAGEARITINPTVAKAFLLSGTDDAPTLHRADIDPLEGTFGEWEEIPLPELAPGEAPLQIVFHDESIVLVTAHEQSVRAWRAHSAFPVEQLEWKPTPYAEVSPDGTSAAVAIDKLFLLGGAESGRGVRSYPRYLDLNGTNSEPWKSLPFAQDARTANSVATSLPSTVIMLPVLAEANDEPTSLTGFIAHEIGTGQMGLWRETILAPPTTGVRQALIDELHRALLVVQVIGDDAMISSYRLPPVLYEKRPTGRDIVKATLQDRLPVLPQENLADALEAAKEARYAVVLITGDEEDEFDMRTLLHSTRFRYMTRDLPRAHLGGDDGARFLRDTGLSGAPAVALVDPQGKIVSSHAGSIPDSSELFTLTSFLRRAPVTPEPEEQPLPSE